MSRLIRLAPLAAPLLFVLAAMLALPAQAQEPGMVTVSIYRVAPGKQLDFLRWQAARDALATQVGVAPTQWYVHMDGDSWDFIGISPATTEEQDDKFEQLAQGKGLTTGFKAGLEMRTMVASHTDTFARGPMSAQALVDAAK